MKEETKKILGELTLNWQKARDIQNRNALKRGTWESSFETVNGYFSWNNEKMVMLCDFVDGSGYEEYGSIVGLTEEGKLVWEYQSHCSCNDFEDSEEYNGELLHGHILEKKTFELNDIPLDWEEKVKASAQKLLEHL